MPFILYINNFQLRVMQCRQLGQYLTHFVSRILLVGIVPFVRVDLDNLLEIGEILKNLCIGTADDRHISLFDRPSMDVLLSLGMTRKKDTHGLISRIDIDPARHGPEIGKHNQGLPFRSQSKDILY